MSFISRTTLASVSALIVVAGSSLATAQLNSQPLLTSGSAAPGGLPGVRLDEMHGPSVAGNGQIAFRASLTGFGVNANNNAAIFAGGMGPGVPMRMLARLGTRPAGLPAGTRLASLGDPLVNAAGSAVYLATLSGTGVTFSNNKVVIVSDSRGTRIIARTGQAAPGMASNIIISDLQQPLISANGHVAYSALFSGPQMWYGTNRAMYVAAPGATPVLTARQNGQVTGQASGVTWANFNTPVLTSSGQLIFMGFMQGAGILSASDGVLYSSAGQILAREGDSFGVPGLSFRSFSSPTISGETVGFMAMLTDANSPTTRGGVFTATASGVQLIARTGQTDGSLGSGACMQLFGQPTLASGGKVAFLSTLTGSGIAAGLTDIALWSADSSGLLQVARSGSAIPGSPDVLFDAIDQPALANTGHVVFTARLRGSGVASTNDSGIFAFHPDTGLITVARTGRGMDIGGNNRTPVELEVSGTSGDGRPSCLTDTGTLLYLLNTSASSVAVRATLPLTLADIAGSASLGADGRVDQSDLTTFLSLFAAGNLGADVTGTASTTRDGQVTSADMQSFMNAFNGWSVASAR